MLKMDIPEDIIFVDIESSGCGNGLSELCGGKGWPPPEDALSALVDLGMSDDQLALYFCVGIACVKHYRHKRAPARETTGRRQAATAKHGTR